MVETFTAIFTAHLLGDFVFQTGWTIERKRKIWVLLLHCAIVVAISYLLLGTLQPLLLTAILLAHGAVDAVKVYVLSDRAASFLADQVAHLAVLAVLSVRFPDAARSGWWMTHLGAEGSKIYFCVLTSVAGIILCVSAGGILISKLIRRFADEVREDDIAGLKQGGKYIGWLERSLVMLLLLIDQPNGIGLLMAAKSILRFGEIKDASQRKVAEYIIIGTFLSFGWALSVAVVTQKVLKWWLR